MSADRISDLAQRIRNLYNEASATPPWIINLQALDRERYPDSIDVSDLIVEMDANCRRRDVIKDLSEMGISDWNVKDVFRALTLLEKPTVGGQKTQ